ncbi:MAG TPA: T9SS type A sorting domain-containing protein, partial [Panacibacter sp.]|nr:T9SS type A sorting domain-containing protein [Panacibacter sp.]
EYDPGNNRWTQKLDFSGTARALATGLSIGEKGYIGTGNDGNYKEDIFEFDPEINTWTLKTDLAGGPRKNAVGLSIGGYGYIGFGSAIDENKNDWWRYTPSTVLPLQLTSFTAAHTGKTNLLQWSSTQEINTSHFVIERSSNSNLFSKIGTVKTNGSGLQNNYSFTDQQPLKATNYYRLKITDKDSSFTCSKIKSLSNNLSFDVSITPNPVANGFINLTINTESLAAITITITTINGKILYTRQFAAVNGNLTKNIDVAAFAKGVYVLKATSGKESKMIKFVME